MEVISEKLKARYCKDANLSVNVFKEPYFTERMKLLDEFYSGKGIVTKYRAFTKFIMETFQSEQDYFELYNQTKDKMINSIKESEGYQVFNTTDMNAFACKNIGFKSKDIFHDSNDKRIFISVDMRKANFSSLSAFDPSIFGEAETWEEYVTRYTDINHIINSKYIRQVILGNCNPKRHVTFEKYIMDYVLTSLLKEFSEDKIVFFSNDEIVIDITDFYQFFEQNDVDRKQNNDTFISKINKALRTVEYDKNVIKRFPKMKIKVFKLYKISGDGYIERDLTDDSLELKCVNAYQLPFILRKLLNEEYKDADYVFMHETKILSKFLEEPNIQIPEELIRR